jgi:hypothetical protein
MEERMTLPGRAQLATSLLSCVLPQQDVETIIGDLEEEYVERSQCRSERVSWYWIQVVRSLPTLLWLPIHRNGWRSTIAVAFVACAAQAAIEVGTGVTLFLLSSSDAWWSSGVALLVTLLSLVVVSYHGTRVRPGAAALIALTAVVATAVKWLFSGAGRDVVAGQLVALLVLPTTALMGGALSLRLRGR